MDKIRLCRIITVYDPSNNIIKPIFTRQKRFYNKINKPIPEKDKEDNNMIGNKIEDIIDYKTI
jgi:exonuclease III